jgi:hypothetical protein
MKRIETYQIQNKGWGWGVNVALRHIVRKTKYLNENESQKLVRHQHGNC